MEFDHLAPSKAAPRRPRNAPVFAVGCRVFVHRPARGLPAEPVTPLDTHGHPITTDFGDGQQVEIVAWQPRSREGLLYHVRRLSDGRECWIGAHDLRREALASVPDPTPPPMR